MPCDGPSIKHAHSVGDKIADEFEKRLLDEYKISPDGLPFPRDIYKQHENFTALRNLIKEIVWYDHASSF